MDERNSEVITSTPNIHVREHNLQYTYDNTINNKIETNPLEHNGTLYVILHLMLDRYA